VAVPKQPRAQLRNMTKIGAMQALEGVCKLALAILFGDPGFAYGQF